jgi:sigma-B regulation protein RsbU (phosphoserine phosphatase)
MMPDLGSMLETQVFHLATGDVLVLYTDGVIEAASAEGVEYGSERLVDTIRSLASQRLAARTIAESVVAEVLRHAPKHDDDVSVLVIRRRPAA